MPELSTEIEVVEAPASRAAEPAVEHEAFRPDSLARSVVLLLGMTVLQRTIGFGRSIFFCRWLDPEQLGQWDLTFAFLELAAPIAVLSLPASFGRYVEHYRQRGQLRTFLHRMGATILLLLAASAAILYLGRFWFSDLLYGRSDSLRMMMLITLALPALVLYNSLCELFGGLRMYRVVSGLDFLQSLLFAAIGLTLIRGWNAGADSILIAFAVACAFCSLLPLTWLVRTWRTMPAGNPVSHTRFWGKLLPFVASVWVSNWCGNLFSAIDRYLIVHYSGKDASEALVLVGQYHSSRVVPLLLVTLSMLLSTMIVPFLSCEWEAGRRQRVSESVNTLVKLAGFGLVFAAALVLLASPLLFGWAFAGKYDAGLAVLPWTLMYSVWFGMFCMAKTYLWCDERVWLVSLSFLAGITASIGLNLLWLPSLGLLGAVLAKCFANLTVLLTVYGFARRRGMQIQPGTWFVSALPAVLGMAPWAMAVALTVAAGVAVRTELIFAREEKMQLISVAQGYLDRLRSK